MKVTRNSGYTVGVLQRFFFSGHVALTKGDLDIQIRIARKNFRSAKAILAGLYKPLKGAFRGRDGASFKDDSTNPSVGIHLTATGGSCDFQWKHRDLLRKRKDLRIQYDALKARFQGKSMKAYRAAKEKFMKKRLEPFLLAAILLLCSPALRR